MATKCSNCPLRKKALFTPVSKSDIQTMQRFKAGEMTVEAGTTLLMEGSNSPQLFTALNGMGLRYKTLADGSRQVINLIFPGDFIGLQAGVMKEMKHSVEATTDMTLCVFDRTEFYRFFKSNPELGFDITWLAAVAEHFLGETLTTVGQRKAMPALAWALHSIFERGKAIGLVRGNQMRFPYRQQDLADALGLSLVHTNKTLGKLRDLNAARWEDSKLQVLDQDKLAEIAMIDEIILEPRPLM